MRSAAFLIPALVIASGCITTREQEAAEPRNVELLPISVRISAPTEFEAEELAGDLREIGLFASVSVGESTVEGSQLLVIRERVEPTEFCATHEAGELGLFTYLTLLTFPWHVCDIGYVLRFARPGSTSSIDFRFDYRADSFIGPYFLPMLFSDRWHWGFPASDVRRIQLSEQLQDRLEEIQALLSR